MRKSVFDVSLLLLAVVLMGCASLSQKSTKLSELENENAALKTENQSLHSKMEKGAEQSKTRCDALNDKLQDEVKQGQLTITQYKNMLKVEIAEKLFFNSGSAKLKESGKIVLKKLAESLKTMPDTVIRVVGHTDNVPIKSKWQKLFPTNWELSTLRATTVVRYLQEAGSIPADSLVAVGRGENDPIATNDTDAGRMQNRRIEIGIVDKELEASLGEIQNGTTGQHPQ